MKNQYYGFELKDMVRQFITAFNSIVINRYNKAKTVVDQLKVGFYYGPKPCTFHVQTGGLRILRNLINFEELYLRAH